MGAEGSGIDSNKINKYNLEDLYCPPAVRNHGNEAIKRIVTETRELIRNETSINNETKEPTLPPVTVANTSITTTPTSISCNNSPKHRNENVNTNNFTTSTQQTSINKSQQQQQVDEQQKHTQRQQPTRRERRPDRAVYIPRARRSQTTPPNTTTDTQLPPQQQQSTQLPAVAPKTTSDTSKSLNQQLPITLDDATTALVSQKPSTKTDEVSKINIGSAFHSTFVNTNSSTTLIKKKEKLNKENKESREQRREQRLLRKLSSTSTHNTQNLENAEREKLNESSKNITIANQAFIVNAQHIQSSSSLANDVNNFRKLNDNINNLSKGFNCDIDSSKDLILNQYQEISKSCIENNVTTKNIFINNSNTINTMPKPSMKPKCKLNSEVINQTKLPHLCIEDVASQQSPTKCDIEEQELQRASKEINRSNRRIIKQTFISDILEIPDHVNEENVEREKVAEDNIQSITYATRTATQIDSNTDEEEGGDEDNWENMYNDSGDCLDPKIIQELTASVGKCKIELPKMDYSAYLTKQSILNDEEFPHVLEVSNFPVEFKNQDLLMVFSQYKESGFDIKWVDDTHALAVFSSSRIAAEVLTMGHPFVVLKPLAEATVESRLKAKKCAASLQPYRARPETCAALARRLVTGALGVRLKTAAAERENEKRVLREAKERKLLAAKQRDEFWEC